MLSIGDVTVYPSHGLAAVEGIKSSEVSGVKVDFYILKIFSSGATVMVPTSACQRMRVPLEKAEIDRILETLSEPAKIAQKAWNRRFKEYNEKIRKGAVQDVAQVLRDLWTLRHEKALSFGEKQILEKAWDLMESEFLMAYKYDKPKIKELLEEALNRSFASSAPLQNHNSEDHNLN